VRSSLGRSAGVGASVEGGQSRGQSRGQSTAISYTGAGGSKKGIIHNHSQ